MSFACPRCGGRNTQSLPMVYGTGTYTRNWRSSSGYSGSTVSQSIVSGLANPPVQMSVARPVILFVLLWLFMGTAVYTLLILPANRPPEVHHAEIIDGRTHRVIHRATAPVSSPASQKNAAESVLLGPAVFTLCFSVILVLRIIRANRFNSNHYPLQFLEWQSSFLCKACGTRFLPPDRRPLVQHSITSADVARLQS